MKGKLLIISLALLQLLAITMASEESINQKIFKIIF